MESKMHNGDIRQHLQQLYLDKNIDLIYADEYRDLTINKSLPFKFIYLWMPDFEDEISTKIYNKAITWLDNLANFKDVQWLYFCGPVGVCKTALASTILKYAYCILRNKKVRDEYKKKNFIFDEQNLIKFWSSYDLVKDFINNAGEFVFNKQAYVLVLDDITKPSNDFYSEVLDSVLRYRELNCLPTIMTSQVNTERLSDVFALPLCDLIKGNCDEVVITGDSKRRNNG